MLPIIVPVFHQSSIISRLLEDLHKQSFKDWELIIVYHGGGECSVPQGHKITILKESSDLWFTAAMNRGISWALKNRPHVPFLALANDDIRLSSSNFLQNLYDEASQIRLLGVPARDPTGLVLYSSIHFSSLMPRFFWKREFTENSVACDALPTRFLIAPRRVFDTIGLLDEEKFPMYFSDYEWSVRALAAGFSLSMVQHEHVITALSEKSKGPGQIVSSSVKLLEFWRRCWSPYQSDSLILWARFLLKNHPVLFPHGILYQLLRKLGGFCIGKSKLHFHGLK